jgi:hypothetical protein
MTSTQLLSLLSQAEAEYKRLNDQTHRKLLRSLTPYELSRILEHLQISRATFYRKMKENSFTTNQLISINNL